MRAAITYGIQNAFNAYELDLIMINVNGDLTEEIYIDLSKSFRKESNAD